MFDIKAAYIDTFTKLADLRREEETNESLLQAYETLLNVIQRDSRFKRMNFIELSQPQEKDED